MKELFRALVCFVLLASPRAARATVYYWDPEGTAAASAGSLAGAWSTNAEWSTSSSQTSSLVAWSPGTAADFSAGSTTVTTPITVTVNSTISIAGIFNGTLNPPGSFVTLSGAGSLSLVAGPDAFATGGLDGGTTTVAVPLTGPGEVALEGSAQIFFNATNTYSGGTSIGYPGVTAFTSVLNFNNGFAFGTGPIQMTTSATGSLKVTATTPVTVTNSFFASNTTLMIVGNAAGLTFSGPWALYSTPYIGASNLVIISGPMSGPGGFTKYGPGTVVLSGSNSYSGLTTISNGVLSISADDNLGAAPTVANYALILSGGVLAASNSLTLNSNRLIQLTANSSINVAGSNVLNYSGIIGGPSGFSKTGTGTLVLTENDSYSGATAITGGNIEADTQTGSALGTNTVNIQSAGMLSGAGLVSGTVSGTGFISPGTSAGPALLTLGHGLNLNSGGTFVWSLASDSTTSGFSTLALNSGNLALGGTSKLSISLIGSASSPAANNPFWQTQEAWTIINLGSAASNSTSSSFTTISNGVYGAGTFSNYISGGNVVLLYQPSFAVFDALYDSGPGFFSGENLILTNFSGLDLSVWSSTNAGLSVSNWTIVGQMAEQSLAPALPGYSRYTINVNPTASPAYYLAGNINTGPYLWSPVATTIVTTPDYLNFTVMATNVAISPLGVLALLPPPPAVLPGAGYLTNGFEFEFTAATNQSYTIEASSDLMTWSNIESGVVSTSPVLFIDTGATNYSYRFYRVVVP